MVRLVDSSSVIFHDQFGQGGKWINLFDVVADINIMIEVDEVIQQPVEATYG
jgi:hypothetical protein